MRKPVLIGFLGLLLAAIPARAQTTSELLQKGIYAQETEGNLDNAILIYRQIVNSAPTQRDIAAQAQYRLAQALLQKGDLTTASKEFERLARDYSEYGGLVSSLAGQMRPVPAAGGRGGRGPAASDVALQAQQQASITAALAGLEAKLAATRTQYAEGHPDIVRLQKQIDDLKNSARKLFEAERMTSESQALFTTEFDLTRSVTLAGTVSQVMWINPRAWLKMKNSQGDWTFMLASPNALVQTGKMTRATFQPGMSVRITGLPAKDGSQTVMANTISAEEQTGEVHAIFDRAWLTPAP
jgi:TolA-binding protein